MTERPLDFSSEKERHQWIVDNADYYTLVRFRNRRYERLEFATLAEAEEAGAKAIKEDPDAKLMIYAVAGLSDTFIKSIAP